MKLLQRMCMKTFGLTKISLTIVINHKTVHILIKQTRELIGKFKDEAAGLYQSLNL